MTLLDVIPTGEENAISLDRLCTITGINKRKIRDEISRINTEGEEIICNLGGGYFIARNENEAWSYILYNMHYFNSFIEKDRGMRKCFERKFGNQMRLNFS